MSTDDILDALMRTRDPGVTRLPDGTWVRIPTPFRILEEVAQRLNAYLRAKHARERRERRKLDTT
jgi:hypothetical protein